MLKKRSSPSLQFLPTATAAAMSLRPSPAYRGGRNQWRSRGFSHRPYAPVTDNIVSGDNEANHELRPNYNPRPPPFHFRPNSDPSFNQNQSSQPRGQQPPPYSNPYQQFAPPPLYNQNQQFRRQGPPQSYFNPNQQFRPPFLHNQGQQQPNPDQNQQFRPQGQPPGSSGKFRPQQRVRQRASKPLDYRNWEYVKPGPPPSCERFTVLSYNILADYLAINHRSKLYFHVPRHILDWEFRKRNILFELGLWSADILCFQEVDKFQDLEEDLKIQGYSGIWKMRTGEPVDGCAIFWRSSRFKLLHEEAIEFNKFGLRDNVAQICVLESLNEKSSAGSPAPACSEGCNKVVICNIHVLYNPKRGEIKLGQVRVLLERAYATSRLWDDAPVVLCGDFNSTPKSSLYNFILEQKLNVSELPRHKISGQDSAEIRPKRPFNPTVRAQTTDNTSQTPRRVDNEEVLQEEAGVKGDCISSLSTQPESIATTQKSSAGSFSDATHGNENTSQFKAKEESEGNVEDCSSEGLENISSDAVTDDNSLSTVELGLLHITDDASTSLEETIMKTSPDEALEAIEDVSLSTVELGLLHITDDASTSLEVTMMKTSPDEALEAVEEVSVGEDSTSFLSELHGSDLSDFVNGNETSEAELSLGNPVVSDGSLSIDSEPFMEKPAYDPSAWTPMEIEAATGSSECTTMEHHLVLRSTYSEVKDYSGTRDSNGEPQVTSYHRGFQGTVDYIWRSEGLQTVKVLAPIPKHAMQWTPGFPTKRWGSDHVALVTELAFCKDVDDKKSEVR